MSGRRGGLWHLQTLAAPGVPRSAPLASKRLVPSGGARQFALLAVRHEPTCL
jgi:hypothetical protein